MENVFTVHLYSKEEIEQLQRKHQEELEAQLAASKAAQEQAEAGNEKTVRRQGNKVGRNDPCPCGSGKKFKHCHGA